MEDPLCDSSFESMVTLDCVTPDTIRGEGHVDFLGESEGFLPQPHDSFPDAGEAINDFWSMSGSFIYCHHVEPRVKLHSPREESFPIPLKYIDVTRTKTNLDVKQEKPIDDYWNIDGSRDLSDPWTGFTQFTLLDKKAPEGYTWSGERLTKKQLTSRPDHVKGMYPAPDIRTFYDTQWLRQTAYILTHNMNNLEHIANNCTDTTKHTDVYIAQF